VWVYGTTTAGWPAVNVDASPGEARTESFTRLEAADAAVFETFVVPRYLQSFGELVVEMLAASDEAQLAHLDCRTGYPDLELARRLPGSHLFGCDPSASAIELARAKAAMTPELTADYRVAPNDWPAPFPEGAFSHALSIHPLARPVARAALLNELGRLLAPHGQALLAMPLRGSFPEIADLLREYALKSETVPLSDAVDRASSGRPTVEILGAEMEKAGFEFVDVELRTNVLEWRSGRDFYEDPVTRLVLLPEFRAQLGVDDLDRAWDYVREAIDKYWSDGTFELTVNVGCASGRRTV
jgi:SAM-dependent methyltransferase